MKQWKKTMAVVLAFVMVLTGLNVNPKMAKAADVPKINADSVSATAGEEISIPVKISGNTGIAGLGIDVGFDKEVLTPVDDVKATSLLSGQFNNSIQGCLKDGKDSFIVQWCGTDNMNENGELFTLKFKVAEGATGSTRITLTLREDDTYDEQLENVAVNCEAVTVTIGGGGEPDVPTKEPVTEKPNVPTKEPVTEEPDTPTEEPIYTQTPGENLFNVYISYKGDVDYYWTTGVKVCIQGNGEYSIQLRTRKDTSNVYRLKLNTYEDSLPEGFKIVPTTVVAGNTTYAVGTCDVDREYGYETIIRDTSGEAADALSGAVIPMTAGDYITVNFRIEGLSVDAAPGVHTQEPEEPVNSVPLYLDYQNDEEGTEEWYTSYSDSLTVTGNGNYSYRFVAEKSTSNMYKLSLYAYLSTMELPYGFAITPTSLVVGSKTYPITQWDEDFSYGYEVIIRDTLGEKNTALGTTVVPIQAGETVTLNFAISGMGQSGTPGGPTVTNPPSQTETPGQPTVTNPPSQTETPGQPTVTNPPAQTETPGQPMVTNPPTQAETPGQPTVTNPSSNTNSSTSTKKSSYNYSYSSYVPYPGKVSGLSVKGKKGRMQIKWKKRNCDGYQIQIAKNKKFTKKKYTTISFSAKTTEFRKKGTYYVRVRAYNYSGGGKKYGIWSSVKKCKVK